MVPGLSGQDLIGWNSQGLVGKMEKDYGNWPFSYPLPTSGPGWRQWPQNRSPPCHCSDLPQKGQCGGGARGRRDTWRAHPTCPFSCPPNTFIATHLALSQSLMGMVQVHLQSPAVPSISRSYLTLWGSSSCVNSIRRPGRAGLVSSMYFLRVAAWSHSKDCSLTVHLALGSVTMWGKWCG